MSSLMINYELKPTKKKKNEENSQNEPKSLENEASYDSRSESEGLNNDEAKYPKEKKIN